MAGDFVVEVEPTQGRRIRPNAGFIDSLMVIRGRTRGEIGHLGRPFAAAGPDPDIENGFSDHAQALPHFLEKRLRSRLRGPIRPERNIEARNPNAGTSKITEAKKSIDGSRKPARQPAGAIVPGVQPADHPRNQKKGRRGGGGAKLGSSHGPGLGEQPAQRQAQQRQTSPLRINAMRTKRRDTFQGRSIWISCIAWFICLLGTRIIIPA